jgi:hypothetical protein
MSGDLKPCPFAIESTQQRPIAGLAMSRYYLRIDGVRICRLPDDLNSEEFTSAYWKARKAARPAVERVGEAKAASVVVKPNSFRWLCMEYMRSNAFITLDQSTQTRRRNIMESMWAEPLSDKDDRPFSDIPLPKLTRVTPGGPPRSEEGSSVCCRRAAEGPAPGVRHQEGRQADHREHRSTGRSL